LPAGYLNTGRRIDEVYDISHDVMHMLCDEPDAALLAASKRLEFEPGSVWKYATGSPIILSRILRLRAGGTPSDFYRYARTKLFGPVGMESLIFEPDASGDLAGVYATTRDWARFGMLFLNDGVWGGERILPEGWVEYSTTVTPGSPKGMYGAYFWLNAGEDEQGTNRRYPSLPSDLYMATGHNSQIIVIIPSHHLVIVRLGRTTDGSWDTEEFVAQVISAIDKDFDVGEGTSKGNSAIIHPGFDASPGTLESF
jgi:CubicO group peptidase (beta-lactamase class C family)